MIWLIDLLWHWNQKRKAKKNAERLAASLKPRPDLRERRFREWSPERKARYLNAVEGL